MKVQRGYKTELDPNNKQRTLLVKNAGSARYAFNWGLEQKQAAFQNKQKMPTAIDLHKQLNKIKKTELPWMYEVSKCSPQEALRNLDVAFKNFFDGCKKKVKKKGFPKKKSKKHGLGSFRLTGSIHVSDTHIQLPRIGKVNLKEHGYIPIDKKIISATISEKAGKWFVSVLVEQEIEQIIKQPASIGIDLGIKTLAVCSDGQTFDNPKALRGRLKKLQRLSRWASRKTKNGKNRNKARKKLAKLHFHIGNIRKDTLHKITTHLTKTKSKIVIEDLNVSGMMKNRKLSRSIADLGLFEFRRQLEYKGKWYECEVITANRFFPSSKTCSCCGNIKQDLKLSDRVYRCDACGKEIDRDLNAAKNLETYTASSAGINAFGDGSSGSCENKSETTFDELGMKQEVCALA